MTDIAKDVLLCDRAELRGNRRAVFLLTRLGYSPAELKLLFGSPQDRNLRSAVDALSSQDEDAPHECSAAEIRNGQGFRECFRNSDVRPPAPITVLDDMGRERSAARPQQLTAEDWAHFANGLDCTEPPC